LTEFTFHVATRTGPTVAARSTRHAETVAAWVLPDLNLEAERDPLVAKFLRDVVLGGTGSQVSSSYRAGEGVSICFRHAAPAAEEAILAVAVFGSVMTVSGCCACSQRRTFLIIAVQLMPRPQAPITPPTVMQARPTIMALEFRKAPPPAAAVPGCVLSIVPPSRSHSSPRPLPRPVAPPAHPWRVMSARVRFGKVCRWWSASAEDVHVGWAHVNAEFFFLAIGSALNPKLLAIDLVLARNRRARAMFLCVLGAAFVVALAIGLIDVLVIKAQAIDAQRRASAGVDLALGVLLLTTGSLIFARRPPRRRRLTRSSASGDSHGLRAEKNGWARRVLREPRPGVAVVIGAIIGLPGALYLTALHRLVAGHLSTTTQVIAVVVFVVIELSLIVIPFLFLEFQPANTTAMLERSQGWLLTHARQAIAWIAVLLGGYLVISALVRLL
jgi:hypothetical protein